MRHLRDGKKPKPRGRNQPHPWPRGRLQWASSDTSSLSWKTVQTPLIQWIQWRFWLGGPFIKMNWFLISLASWVGDTPKSCQWCHVHTPFDGKNTSISRYEIRKLGEKRKNLGYELFSYLAPVPLFPKKRWEGDTIAEKWFHSPGCEKQLFLKVESCFCLKVWEDSSRFWHQWSQAMVIRKRCWIILEIRLQICSIQNRPRDLKSCI